MPRFEGIETLLVKNNCFHLILPEWLPRFEGIETHEGVRRSHREVKPEWLPRFEGIETGKLVGDVANPSRAGMVAPI